MFALIQNLRRAVSLPVLLLPALLLPVAASAVTGVADEIITPLYTDLSLAAPTTTSLAMCRGFDCEYHTEVALADAGRVKLAELVASGRGSPGLFSPR